MNTSALFLRMFSALSLCPSLFLKLIGAKVIKGVIELNIPRIWLCVHLENPLTESDCRILRESIRQTYVFMEVELEIANKEELSMRLNITSGVVHRAQKVVIYGPEGIGKSTLASKFPDPLFIDTEAGTQHMDVRRTDAPTSWSMLMETVRAVRDTPGVCRTLVLDTADWAELLCMNHVIAMAGNSNITSIEDYGYGKGYVYLQEEFGRLLNLMSELVDRGIHVVITAHAKMRKFEQPDEMGAYDRWEMKLSKQVGPLLKEWCDLLLFANYKTISVAVNVDKKGNARTHKGQGGKRMMYTSHHACWDAKNRMGLPEELPLDYEPLAQYFDVGIPTSTTVSASAPAIAESDRYFIHPESDSYWMIHRVEPLPEDIGPSEEISKEQYEAGLAAKEEYQSPVPKNIHTDPATPLNSANQTTGEVMPDAPPSAQTAAPPVPDEPFTVGTDSFQMAAEKPCAVDETVRVTPDGYVYADGTPLKTSLQEFYPLMEMGQVTADEVRGAIAYKGYFPADTPLENLPDDFIRGVLIGAWDQVKAMVENMREDDDLPF